MLPQDSCEVPPAQGRRIEDQALPLCETRVSEEDTHTLHPPTLKALTAPQIRASPIVLPRPFSAVKLWGEVFPAFGGGAIPRCPVPFAFAVVCSD
eukprot:2955053-Amphidinium_carterae.1